MHLLKSISKEIFQEVFGFWTLKFYAEDGNIHVYASICVCDCYEFRSMCKAHCLLESTSNSWDSQSVQRLRYPSCTKIT